jgi:hypothetical protein
LEGLRLGSLSILDNEERREAIAVADIERPREEREAFDGLRIEGAGQSDHGQVFERDDESVRVVDLNAVHDRQVLIRTAAANRDPTAKLLRAGNARERLQGSKDVLETARKGLDLL